MEKKCCKRCKQHKKITEFYYSQRDGHFSLCKNCRKYLGKERYKKEKDIILARNRRWRLNNRKRRRQLKKEWYATHPWQKHIDSARQRCNNPNLKLYRFYGEKGIKYLMTPKDMKNLWFRDKAYLLKRPSIDRKNTKGNYTFDNCQFIELSENCRKDMFGNKNGVGKRKKKGVT